MSTREVWTAAPAPPHRARRSVADLLVIGGALLAPLNLLLVRSLTVYDIIVLAGFLALVHERRLMRPPPAYLAAAYVFVLAAALSAFRATFAAEALTQILQYAFIFFVQVPAILSVVRTRGTALASLALLCVGTVGATFYAYLSQDTQGSGRVLVFYSENPNRLGYPTAYVMPFLLVLWQASRSFTPGRKAATRLLCLGAGYLSVWAVAASGSRSSAVGTAAALLVFVVLRPGIGFARMAGRATLLVAVVLGGIGALAATGSLPSTLEHRVEESRTAEHANTLVADREHLANAAVRAFVEFPWLGTGLDNFRYVTPNFDLEATPQLPHNLWLQLLVQVGVFGTAAFALLLLLWLRDLVRVQRLLPEGERSLSWGLVSAMAGILTIFMFAPEMLDRHYWLIFGLGLASVSWAHESRTGTGRST